MSKTLTLKKDFKGHKVKEKAMLKSDFNKLGRYEVAFKRKGETLSIYSEVHTFFDNKEPKFSDYFDNIQEGIDNMEKFTQYLIKEEVQTIDFSKKRNIKWLKSFISILGKEIVGDKVTISDVAFFRKIANDIVSIVSNKAEGEDVKLNMPLSKVYIKNNKRMIKSSLDDVKSFISGILRTLSQEKTSNIDAYVEICDTIQNSLTNSKYEQIMVRLLKRAKTLKVKDEDEEEVQESKETVIYKVVSKPEYSKIKKQGYIEENSNYILDQNLIEKVVLSEDVEYLVITSKVVLDESKMFVKAGEVRYGDKIQVSNIKDVVELNTVVEYKEFDKLFDLTEEVVALSEIAPAELDAFRAFASKLSGKPLPISKTPSVTQIDYVISFIQKYKDEIDKAEFKTKFPTVVKNINMLMAARKK